MKRMIMLSILISCAAEGVLTLEESIETALLANRGLHSSYQKIVSAEAKLAEAKSRYLPTLRIESSYTRLDEALTLNIGPGFSLRMREEELYNLELKAQQSLFNKETGVLKRIAEANLRFCEQDYRRCRDELILEVKSAYFKVLEAEKIFAVSKEAVSQVEAHLSTVRNLYDVGMATKVDVLRTEVQLATAKERLLKAENGFRLAKAKFNSVLGRDLDAEVELVDVLHIEPVVLNLREVEDVAVKKRPEIMAIKERVKACKANVDLVKSERYPTIMIFGSYDYTKGERLEMGWKGDWAVGIMASFVLWDAGVTKARTDQAVSYLKQMEDAEIELKDRIILEVRETYLSIKEAENAIYVAEKQVVQAEEVFERERSMYEEGASISTNVLDAQTLLTQAKTRYWQALYKYNLALAKMERVVGTSLW